MNKISVNRKVTFEGQLEAIHHFSKGLIGTLCKTNNIIATLLGHMFLLTKDKSVSNFSWLFTQSMCTFASGVFVLSACYERDAPGFRLIDRRFLTSPEHDFRASLFWG